MVAPQAPHGHALRTKFLPETIDFGVICPSGLVPQGAISTRYTLQSAPWNRWAYHTIMPPIPGLGVGLFPVVQMVVLPLLTARLTRWWLLRPRTATR